MMVGYLTLFFHAWGVLCSVLQAAFGVERIWGRATHYDGVWVL